MIHNTSATRPKITVKVITISPHKIRTLRAKKPTTLIKVLTIKVETHSPMLNPFAYPSPSLPYVEKSVRERRGIEK